MNNIYNSVVSISMHRLLTTILLSGLLLAPISSSAGDVVDNCSLSIRLKNIRNTKGSMFIFVYKYENQYPWTPQWHFEVDKSKVKDGMLTYTVQNLPKGKYAISILDDENANSDLDRFLGIPSEGFGFSNNIRPLFSLPDYDELTFDLTTTQKTVNLTLQYIL